MKKIPSLFLAFLLVAQPAHAEILQYSPTSGGSGPTSVPVPVAQGGTGATTASAARSNLGLGAVTKAGLQPVCIRGNLPSDTGLTPGTNPQLRGRMVYFCPQGAKSISLMYAGVWANATVETDLVDPIPLSVGIEVPAGTAGGTLSSAPIPVTCNGQRPCTLPTSINTSAATVTQGFLITDPIPVNVPVGGYIAVRTYVGQSSGQKVAWGIYDNYALGESCAAFSSAADNSLTTSVAVPNVSACVNPTGILGIPQNPVTSACLIGDSIGSGYVTHGLAGAALAGGGGGSGYVSGDVGKILTVPGGTTNGIAIPAQVIITAVTAGAVSGVALYNQGSYAIGSEPTSPQSPTGSTTGSGLSITFAIGGSYDFGDTYGDKGYVQRALGSTIPFVAFTRGSDSIQGWVNRDYGRIQMIVASGCKDVIFELGVNDRTGGKALMESNAKIVWQQLLDYGLNVYADTITPVSTSTDGFATTGNQTQDPYLANINGYNDDLRANYASWGLSGVFDVNTAVSTGLDSGYWASTGTIGYSTIDGTHPEGQGILNAASAINVSTLK